MMMSQNFDFEFSELAVLSRIATVQRQPNVLIHCSEDAKAFVASQASEWCRAPFHVCRLPGPLSLPEKGGTVLLNDVATLTLNQQIQLFDWMSGHVTAHVVSITSADICGLIEDGEFLEGLYYRLNTLLVDATEQGPLAASRRLATNGRDSFPSA
jgi:transcriptional regulator of acetoin/glycerol metabolism